MATSTPPHLVTLGVSVGAETIDAVAVLDDGGRTTVVGRYVRPRGRAGAPVTTEALAMALPGLKGSSDSDYTLEVGDGSSSSTQFSPSEFGLKTKGNGKAGAQPASRTRPFAVQLREIVAEATADGHAPDRLAFVIGHPDVSALAISIPAEAAKDSRAGRKRLMTTLEANYAGPVDEARTAFVPMAPDNGQARTLAVVAAPTEPVSATLDVLRERDEAIETPTRADAETAVLADLVRAALPDATGTTALVRVGVEDTLLLLFQGGQLADMERIRSLTAYDLPETVSSRLLLQFDQKKVSDLGAVYVMSTGRPEVLLTKLRLQIPDTAVESVSELLALVGLDSEDTDAFKAGPLTAAATAVQPLPGAAVRDLLPAATRVKRRRAAPPQLLTIVSGVVLAAVLALAVFRFLGAQSEIREIEQDLAENPPVLPTENPDMLQARVDSLALAHQTYTRALDILDSLLLGSDQWTQALRLTTRTMDATGGVWLQSWAPDPPNVRVTGQALSRPRIVELARRLSGDIEMLEYTDVGPTRVYTFDMLMPVATGMPEVSLFLREVAAQGEAGRDSLMSRAAADTDGYSTNPGGHTH